jgi:lysophospholipase L1-like esterase
MKASRRNAIFASFVAVMAFPLAIPGETHMRLLQIMADANCRISAAMPARVAALPHFAQALASGGRVRIVAIGSSSTVGVGASSPAASYPSQLRALLETSLPRDNFEVINLGVGGETASKTAERLRRDIPALAPDLVVWQVGTNDALTGVPVADYEKTLHSSLQFLRAQGLDVVLVGVQWTRKFAGNDAYTRVRDANARVARLEGVNIVSRYDAMRQLAEATGREDLIGPDNLHMNDRGYRCLAEEIAGTLANAVAPILPPTAASEPQP